MIRCNLCISLLLAVTFLPISFAWDANWESLDSRPLPAWYDEAKFGIFIHWGVFSVPSFGTEWFWWQWKGAKDPRFEAFVEKTEGPRFAYADYAHRFDAALYRPAEWAKLFANSGAQYVVLTSKHHEGFCNWDSRDIPTTWNWNAVEVGPRRDILGDLAKAIKKTQSPITKQNLRWGVYHSLLEWFNPLFRADVATNFETTEFRDTKTMPELYDLVKKYEPELIWSDGDWDAPDSYWRAPEFLAWYATNSTVANTAVWNDRWGKGIACKHGAYITCNDRYQPGKLVTKKWENALTIDPSSWGLNRNTSGTQYLSTEYFVWQLIETIAFGGNMLLNVGPAADGHIPAIFWDRLLGIGDWLKVNGEAIYSTTPWTEAQNETAVGAYYTFKEETETVYALVTKWPKDNRLALRAPQVTPDTKVRMLGLDGAGYLSWTSMSMGNYRNAGIVIEVPPLTPDKIPCNHAWAFAIMGLGQSIERIKT